MESILSAILVVFVIRTRSLPWRSRPATALILASLGVLTGVVGLLLSPAAGLFGFVRPPVAYYPIVAVIVFGYLAAAQIAKAQINKRTAVGPRPTSIGTE